MDLNLTPPAGVVTDITFSAASGLTLTEEGHGPSSGQMTPVPDYRHTASEYTPLSGADAAAQGLTPYRSATKLSGTISEHRNRALRWDYVGVTDYDTKVDAT